MKNLILFLISISVFAAFASGAENSKKIFTKEEIIKLTPAYLEGSLSFDNPVLVDVDNDGDFDALKFDNGNVEYYKNTGTLENPSFILDNPHYDKYSSAFFVEPKIPFPLFFADYDGDKDMDMFIVKDKEYNKFEKRYDYKISTAENALDLDTGTLITIILVLVIIILVLAILGK